MTEKRRWYTVTETAKMMALNPETIRRQLRRGKIPGAIKVGTVWRVPATYVIPKDPD